MRPSFLVYHFGANLNLITVNLLCSYYVNASDFTNKSLSSAFSYLHDKENIAEMGRAIGANGPATVGITAEDKDNFHAAFFHGDHFGAGGPAARSEQWHEHHATAARSHDER